MSSKSFSLFVLSIFALVFVMSAVSAVALADITTYTIPSNASQSSGSFNIVFNLVNSGATGALNFNTSTVSVGSIAFNDTAIAVGPATETIRATITFPTSFLGNISGTINVTGSEMTTYKTLPFSVDIIPCSAGNPAQLDVKKIDFKNNGLEVGSFGEDDEWFPLEEIEVEIELENKGNYDVADIELDWGIYDIQNNQWMIDLDKEDEFDLDEGDENALTVTFKIDDDMDLDLDELSDGDNYRFYVVATGTIDDNDATNDGAETCVADFETASIIIEGDFVILDNIQIPESNSCGETVTVTADVWNIGDSDQDAVSVDVYDKDRLFIDKIFEIGDINAFDNAELSVSFEIPVDAEEKTYTLIFDVLDEDGDIYKNDFDDDESTFSLPLKVSGSCSVESQVSVAASTVSGGQEGQKLVVKATITNNAGEQKTYSLSTSGFEAWASESSLDSSTIMLNAGESKDVLVTLNVNKDAAGSQTFSIVMTSGSEMLTQPVTVSIEESKGLFGITGNVISGNNWYIWGIGLLNIILIVVIILVAVRIARK